MRTQLGTTIPGGGSSGGPDHQPEKTDSQCVSHRAVGCEGGSDVSAEDSVQRPVYGGQSEERIGHRLALRREHACRVYDGVGSRRESDDHYDAGKTGDSTAAQPPATGLCHGLWPSDAGMTRRPLLRAVTVTSIRAVPTSLAMPTVVRAGRGSGKTFI